MSWNYYEKTKAPKKAPKNLDYLQRLSAPSERKTTGKFGGDPGPQWIGRDRIPIPKDQQLDALSKLSDSKSTMANKNKVRGKHKHIDYKEPQVFT